MSEPFSKARLIEALRRNQEEALATVRSLEPASLEAGRYENGWIGRQILAHLAAIEWTYPRLIDLAKTADASVGEAGRADGSARDGMDGYNARQVEKRASPSVDELLAEWQRNREAFIAAIEATADDLFNAPVRSAGGRVGTLGQVLYEVSIGHVNGHLADLGEAN